MRPSLETMLMMSLEVWIRAWNLSAFSRSTVSCWRSMRAIASDAWVASARIAALTSVATGPVDSAIRAALTEPAVPIGVTIALTGRGLAFVGAAAVADAPARGLGSRAQLADIEDGAGDLVGSVSG